MGDSVIAFVALGYSTIKCLAQMERDLLLSRIARSTQGELNKEVLFKIFAYGALPVLGILASLFPTISNFLFSWVEPTLETLR